MNHIDDAPSFCAKCEQPIEVHVDKRAQVAFALCGCADVLTIMTDTGERYWIPGELLAEATR